MPMPNARRTVAVQPSRIQAHTCEECRVTPLLPIAEVCPAMGAAEPPTAGVVPPTAPTGTVPASDAGVTPWPMPWPPTPGARLLSKPEWLPVPAPTALLKPAVALSGCAHHVVQLNKLAVTYV